MRRDERGFAIPVTVFIITLLTVMLASGFARTRADRQVAEGTELTTEALSVARSGLHQFMATTSQRPFAWFTDTMYVTGGYAIVSGDIVQNPPDTLARQMWILQSTGYVIDAATGDVPRAQRTVAQFAEWQSAAIRTRGAITMPNGLELSGSGIVIIRGDDQCFGQPTTAAIRTAGRTGPNPSPYFYVSGSPNVVNEGTLAGPDVADSTLVDWQGVLDGAIAPDYTTMPSPVPANYPVIVVNGDLDLTDVAGNGLLIVTGDLELDGFFIWSGVILVGGSIDFDGYWSYAVGLIVSGLNEQLGADPDPTEIGTSSGSPFVYLRYSSCAVLAALSGLTGFAPVTNAWVDNWATY